MFVRVLFVFDFVGLCSLYLGQPCPHLLGKSCSLGFSLAFIFSAVLVVRVPFPFGVFGKVWNSIVSIPDHCLFIYFKLSTPLQTASSNIIRSKIDILPKCSGPKGLRDKTF